MQRKRGGAIGFVMRTVRSNGRKHASHPQARAGYYRCKPGLTMNGSLSPRKVMPGGARRSYHRFRRAFDQ